MNNSVSRTVAAFLLALPLSVWSSAIEYAIVFSPTYTNQFVGPRNLEGRLSIEEASIGPAFAGMSIGPLDPALAGILSYTVTLNGSFIYQYNDLYSSQILAPEISSVIRLGASGEVVDLQGAFTLVGTISSVILGRNGYEGSYVDVMQTDPFNSVVVSSGNYQVVQISPVPEPSASAMLMLGLGFVGAICFRRKGKARST